MGSHIVKEVPKDDVPLVRSRHVILLLFLLSVTVYVSVASAGDSQVHPQARNKRNVFMLCSIIHRYTDQWCWSYNNYGCFCGVDSPGGNPVDAVDSCCRDHDHCYNELLPNCTTLLYMTNYMRSCDEEACRCTNSLRWSPCAFRKCVCDLRFALCLRSTTYNSEFYYMNRTTCSD